MQLNGTRDLVRSIEYPTTRTRLVADHGDHVIELQGGEETLGAVLERIGRETYEGPDDVFDALYTGVGHQAVGRRFYSDRDAFTPGEHGHEQVSF
ncbi:MAG: DUF2795 domain-containing protein [Haloferacaceae archaeon]